MFLLNLALSLTLLTTPKDTVKGLHFPKGHVFHKVDTNLVRIFFQIEKEFGHKLPVKWGYRDSYTNRKIGGASHSAHLDGLALDIELKTSNREVIKKLIVLATDYGILGIGVYSDGKTIHLDIDEKKGRRVWGSNYSSNSVPLWAKKEIQRHLDCE